MTDFARLMQRTGEDEGFRAFPYKDTRGLWTFARGRCLETHPLTGAEWKMLLDQKLISVAISPTGADALEEEQLKVVEAALSHDYADFWNNLNDAQQNALIEMAYQMGVVKEEAFHNMIACLRRGDMTGAKAAGLDSDWARQTPARAELLMTQLATGVSQ